MSHKSQKYILSKTTKKTYSLPIVKGYSVRGQSEDKNYKVRNLIEKSEISILNTINSALNRNATTSVTPNIMRVNETEESKILFDPNCSIELKVKKKSLIDSHNLLHKSNEFLDKKHCFKESIRIHRKKTPEKCISNYNNMLSYSNIRKKSLNSIQQTKESNNLGNIIKKRLWRIRGSLIS